MKIALISDIHANLPAMEALVGYNLWPNEVIHLIQQRNIATLAGNHDFMASILVQLVDEKIIILKAIM